MSTEGNASTPSGSSDVFATTRWTLVLAAGQRASPESDAALDALCRAYWYPLYAYVRRRGYTREDAEDLTQGFFARFLARNDLEHLRSERGRFRAFLLAALKHYLANEYDRATCRKRGGATPLLSLDWHAAEERFQSEPAGEQSPDRIYDREWAVALLERVLERLRDECAARGLAAWFDVLRPFLAIGKGAMSYRDAATQLTSTEGAVRVTVHRLRRRYRELLREEIAGTLADPAQVEEELRALFQSFA